MRITVAGKGTRLRLTLPLNDLQPLVFEAELDPKRNPGACADARWQRRKPPSLPFGNTVCREQRWFRTSPAIGESALRAWFDGYTIS